MLAFKIKYSDYCWTWIFFFTSFILKIFLLSRNIRTSDKGWGRRLERLLRHVLSANLQSTLANNTVLDLGPRRVFWWYVRTMTSIFKLRRYICKCLVRVPLANNEKKHRDDTCRPNKIHSTWISCVFPKSIGPVWWTTV